MTHPVGSTRKPSQSGFTLIELMIVIVIIAVLGTIAFPSYQDSVRKSRRSEAKTTLAALAASQEQYFLTYKSYTSSLLGVGPTTENGHYTIGVTLVSPRAYTITATPQGGQANDAKCLNFTLNQAGTKGVSGSGPVADCW